VRKVVDFELDEIRVSDELGPDLNNTILTFYTCSKYSLLPEEKGRMNSAADHLYDVITIRMLLSSSFQWRSAGRIRLVVVLLFSRLHQTHLLRVCCL
jgi:hypothetical protein